jgi:hypothetical protein
MFDSKCVAKQKRLITTVFSGQGDLRDFITVNKLVIIVIRFCRPVRAFLQSYFQKYEFGGKLQYF